MKSPPLKERVKRFLGPVGRPKRMWIVREPVAYNYAVKDIVRLVQEAVRRGRR